MSAHRKVPKTPKPKRQRGSDRKHIDELAVLFQRELREGIRAAREIRERLEMLTEPERLEYVRSIFAENDLVFVSWDTSDNSSGGGILAKGRPFSDPETIDNPVIIPCRSAEEAYEFYHRFGDGRSKSCHA